MIATSISQSQELIRLGLDPATADMCWITDINGEHINADTLTNIQERLDKVYDEQGVTDENWVSLLPAWSLSALLEVMPRKINHIKKGKMFVNPLTLEIEKIIGVCGDTYYCISYVSNKRAEISFSAETMVEAAYTMLCYLLRGLIKKVDKQ